MKKLFYQYAQIYCQENLTLYSDCVNITNATDVYANRKYIDDENNFGWYTALCEIAKNTDKIYIRKISHAETQPVGELLIKAKFVTGRWSPANNHREHNPLIIYECDELREQFMAVGLIYPWEYRYNSRIELKKQQEQNLIKWSIEDMGSQIRSRQIQVTELQKEIANFHTKIEIEKQKISCAA